MFEYYNNIVYGPGVDYNTVSFIATYYNMAIKRILVRKTFGDDKTLYSINYKQKCLETKTTTKINKYVLVLNSIHKSILLSLINIQSMQR